MLKGILITALSGFAIGGLLAVYSRKKKSLKNNAESAQGVF